jgi:UDP-N-acetylglucosamine:LPS N-acetylglucosamine transferase
MKKRYLLASMSVGGGHNALRDSFVATLRDSDPAGTQFDLVLFDSQNEKIPRFYEFAVHKAPWMQAMLYELGRFPTGVRVAVSANRELFREAKTALEQHKPDVVVCTHFLLSMMFARARKELGLDITLVSAIPDYGETTEIFCPNAKDLQADHYIAMDPKTAEHLVVARGLPKERVHLGGFNPRQAFVEAGRDVVDLRASVEKKTAVLSSLAQENPELAKVDPAKPTLVFLGGSAWTSKTLPVIEELLRRPDYLDSVNCVVVCGKNEAFLETMRARVARNARFAVLGFVTPRLMAQVCALADVPVLGSLAPASMHELLETQCGPMMLFHYIPGTEEPHVDYIHSQKIGLYESAAPAMLQNLMELTGFKKPSPALALLKTQFVERAKAIRVSHRQAASKLPRFLASVVRVVGLPLSDLAMASSNAAEPAYRPQNRAS